MATQEKIKVYCYAQHCPSRNGGIVPASEIEAWEGENPEKCDDWDLVAEGTEEEIVIAVRANLGVVNKASPKHSNIMFYRRQLRNALAMLHRPETPARMIDRNAWETDGRIECRGDEFEREEIEPEHRVETDDLTGWCPFTAIWRCGETPEEYTYYVVSSAH